MCWVLSTGRARWLSVQYHNLRCALHYSTSGHVSLLWRHCSSVMDSETHRWHPGKSTRLWPSNQPEEEDNKNAYNNSSGLHYSLVSLFHRVIVLWPTAASERRVLPNSYGYLTACGLQQLLYQSNYLHVSEQQVPEGLHGDVFFQTQSPVCLLYWTEHNHQANAHPCGGDDKRHYMTRLLTHLYPCLTICFPWL